MIESQMPLAARMRPKTLDEYIGQKHLVAEGAVLRRIIESGSVPSFVLWGPPGVGKTTLAYIISQHIKTQFFSLSAINNGVKDIRDVIDQASSKNLFNNAARPILFIDEIHRMSKSQQDSLLGAVEKGIVTLIAATTENPSFEIIPAMLSRCQVYVLQHLSKDELIKVIDHAVQNDTILSKRKIEIKSYDQMLKLSGGDARKLLNIVEIVCSQFRENESIVITDELVSEIIHQNLNIYDKSGEMHYDVISAFIKSMRGSNPDAAVYYLARMIEGGEDPLFICRRMIILASEDIGLANPNALLMANACYQAVHHIGLPEGRIVMSQTAIYLACSAKSNSAYMAIEDALAEVRNNANVPIPLHLRNAPTKLMKELGYGKDYKYAHNYEGNYVDMSFLPEGLNNKEFYNPSNNASEEKVKELVERNRKR